MPKRLLLMSKATHDQEHSTMNLSTDIIKAIADREGTSPTRLSPPLHSVIDPDALNALFQPTVSSDRQREGSVRFTYCGYKVEVDSSGNILTESIDATER